MINYILDDEGNPVPEPDIIKWAQWMVDGNSRILAADYVGPMRVSTAFLGIDHRFIGSGPPMLWETMIFDSPDRNAPMWRYSSAKDALAGHQQAIEYAQRLIKESEPK